MAYTNEKLIYNESAADSLKTKLAELVAEAESVLVARHASARLRREFWRLNVAHTEIVTAHPLRLFPAKIRVFPSLLRHFGPMRAPFRCHDGSSGPLAPICQINQRAAVRFAPDFRDQFALPCEGVGFRQTDHNLAPWYRPTRFIDNIHKVLVTVSPRRMAFPSMPKPLPT